MAGRYHGVEAPLTALPRFSRDPDRTPAILHPGRGQAWWAAGRRVAWHDGRSLWGVVGDDVLVAPCPPPRAVWATATGWRAWTARATLTLEDDARLEDGRIGDEVAVRRIGDTWAVTGLDAPHAVAGASAVWPFPTGRGLLFRSAGWMFRVEGGRVRAVGPATGKTRVAAGPHGSFLLGDRESFRMGAAPGRSAVGLPVALRADAWGVRFSDDGARVSGVGRDGTVIIDLASGAVSRRVGLPVDVDRTLDVDGRLVGFDWPTAAVREASWALAGARLAGPGGAVWDLATGAHYDATNLRLGATVAVGSGWATVDWETGDGAWLDATGEARSSFRLPLRDGESVEGGVAVGEAAVFGTDADCGLSVGPAGDVAGVEAPDLPDAPTVPGLRIGRAGAVICGAAIAVEAGATVGGRAYAWAADGWLVRIR